ncbi:hypothetical protein WJU16_25345 [Chitinophaga pollutisoli]|uniref:Acetyltransferase (GNAT) domain-containing protein n=1 Tax=Chitinophaga pollutisoli TaxID=3133966 RepID=A0ABZ2YNE7_9BACT
MAFNTQPVLENETVQLRPLQESDYPALYAIASDPKIWEQHPNKDRWQEPVFRKFLKAPWKAGALLPSSGKKRAG